MSVFKIAWRSLQHRGLGSLLTILSMALGVMMVVAVLSIHGLVAKSFRTNSSFGFNVLVGARGGGMQLTLSSVYYLSNPVENIPYEYYLAFCDQETREREMVHSFAYQAAEMENDVLATMGALTQPASLGGMTQALVDRNHEVFSLDEMEIDRRGIIKKYTETVVPICLGDFWEAGENLAFRCVATKPSFFNELVLDVDTEEKFQFSEGRCFEEFSSEHGYFECVIGSVVAKRGGLKVGDRIQATHGDPSSDMAHIHEQEFTVVGIVAPTGTPNDRAVFLNMEGFFLMEDHVKPISEEGILKTRKYGEEEYVDPDESGDKPEVPDDAEAFTDPFAYEEKMEASQAGGGEEVDEYGLAKTTGDEDVDGEPDAGDERTAPDPRQFRIRVPIEQREVTSLLVRTLKKDKMGVLEMFLAPMLNEGELETTLDWSAYRPVKSQKAAQSVNPIYEITRLFTYFVYPIRWLLLALTILICIVSAISILVGIYNSMSQRQQEIAVMRALGANRLKVMTIMMLEALLLACLGGLLGWFAGHGMNAMISPLVEARTGVGIGFFDFAPGIPIGQYLWGQGSFLPQSILDIKISPEVLLIPGLMLLAVFVGTYPAISAYKTDVSSSL